MHGYSSTLQCYSSRPDGLPREPNLVPPGAAPGRRLFLCAFLLPPLQPGEEWTTNRLRRLVEAYRAGNHELAAQELLHVDRTQLPARNVEFVAGLDLERPADRARLIAAVLLFTEAAVLTTIPEASDFFLEQAITFTTSFDQTQGTALQKELHLAACYRLFHQRRVADALRVVEPAAGRYPSDPDLLFALGTVAELAGWLYSSSFHLEKARSAYETILVAEPENARASLRMGRVLSLLGRESEAIPHLELALRTVESVPESVVALLLLGDEGRETGPYDVALGLYRRALELDPYSQAAVVALASTLAESGNLELAASELARSLDPAFGISTVDSFQIYLMADSPSHVDRWRELRARIR